LIGGYGLSTFPEGDACWFASPYVRELANMMPCFDKAGYATDPSVLHGTFGVNGLAIEGWAGGVR
jgi:hypothetical protein